MLAALKDPNGKNICSIFRGINNNAPDEFRFLSMTHNSLKNANDLLTQVPSFKFIFNNFTCLNLMLTVVLLLTLILYTSQPLDKDVPAATIKHLPEYCSKVFVKDDFEEFKNLNFEIKKRAVKVIRYENDNQEQLKEV